jgi:tetratricopeptide (TPR) repeat protein
MTVPTETAEEERIVLEKERRLSESLIWGFQRAGYQGNGIENWRQGTLPYYITCNPFIAQAYAKLVWAFCQDFCEAGAYNPDQPIYIVELGSGTGRFAYYFLRQFQRLHGRSRLHQVRFKYVMTDFTAANLDYWETHSHLKPLVAAGILDFASFDIEQDSELTLHVSQERLSPTAVANPIILLANYVLDSVPQDLFGIVNGKLYERLSTITSNQPEPDLTDPELISRIEIAYDNRLVTNGIYEEAVFNQILGDYQHRLANTDILFPSLALRCLDRWRALSGGRLLFLSGDKGYSREEDLLYLEEPYIATHGSVFSMMVNYHAIGRYFALQGGEAFHPSHRHTSLNISAFALGLAGEQLAETRATYEDAIDALSPDDFFLLVTSLREDSEALRPDTALALLRLSQWDSEIFLRNLPAFLNGADSFSELFKEELYWVICKVWEAYYPIGEEWDLAYYIGMLLYQMRYYARALEYLEHSLILYGQEVTTLHNMALCYVGMQQLDTAVAYVEKALALDPEFDAAKALRLKLQADMKRYGPAPRQEVHP